MNEIIQAFMDAECRPNKVYVTYHGNVNPVGTIRDISLATGDVKIDTIDCDTHESMLEDLRILNIPVGNEVVDAWINNSCTRKVVSVALLNAPTVDIGTIYLIDFGNCEVHIEHDNDAVAIYRLQDVVLLQDAVKVKTLIVEADDSETTEEVLLGMAYRYGAEQLVHVVNGVLNYSALRPDGMGDWLLSNANGQLLARSERLPHLLAQVIREWSNEASLF